MELKMKMFVISESLITVFLVGGLSYGLYEANHINSIPAKPVFSGEALAKAPNKTQAQMDKMTDKQAFAISPVMLNKDKQNDTPVKKFDIKQLQSYFNMALFKAMSPQQIIQLLVIDSRYEFPHVTNDELNSTANDVVTNGNISARRHAKFAVNSFALRAHVVTQLVKTTPKYKYIYNNFIKTWPKNNTNGQPKGLGGFTFDKPFYKYVRGQLKSRTQLNEFSKLFKAAMPDYLKNNEQYEQSDIDYAMPFMKDYQ